MKKKILIKGMSWGHCVKSAEEALKGISGVKTAEIDLEGKNAIVELEHEVEDEKFKTTIDEAGYEVVGIEVL